MALVCIGSLIRKRLIQSWIKTMITTRSEKPILFSTPTVQAILGGKKTQTRRLVTPEPVEFRDGLLSRGLLGCGKHPKEEYVAIYGYWKKGDTLWVRETWSISGNGEYVYAASYDPNHPPRGGLTSRWKPAIHMPKTASRITLDVTNVRIQRLQDISEEDAVCEGIEPMPPNDGWNKYTISMFNPPGGLNAPSASSVFAMRWEWIHGDDSWEANPWVWVISFGVQ